MVSFGCCYFNVRLVLVPLKFTGIIGHPFNTMMGIDKVVFGIVLGSIVFSLLGNYISIFKRLNREKVYIPYQKVILPVEGLCG